ncbi:MAG TPA: AAA family ATPase [Fimbriimonadaceae bacterium]|nr:AAA family ATPase [Fimbriimonadaceae bacterium]HRJ95562.1 AAA family ATPase [Fimbriimonadaceae bacterium]
MDPDSPIHKLLDRIAEQAPKEDAKLQNYLAALRKELADQEKTQDERAALLAEYEEAYQKLTAPANRVGVFLQRLEEDRILIALGETEYVALADPKIPEEELVPGARVTLNEAYAVVGVMPPHPGGTVLKVAEVLEDGRLRVGSDPQNLQGRLVLRGAPLAQAKIDKGDEVRVDPSMRVALEHFPHQDTRDYFMEEVEEIPWEKVGGQDDAIQLIRDTIEQPLLYPELYAKFDKKPIKGLLLYGPPGCGKTLLGKATAYNLAKDYSARVGHEVKEYFMHISGPKILNMWLGETERMVREIFEVARSRAKEGRLVVIFMDEAESVLRTRSSGRWLNISNTVVPQFCAELDGLVSLENVVLILTSNRPDYIDPAVLRPERIDRKVKIARPDRLSSLQILGIYLHDRLPLDPSLLAEFDGEIACARRDLLEATTAYLWRQSKDTEFLRVVMRSGSTENLYWKDLVSGALLKSVVDRAKDSAIRRSIAEPGGQHGLSRDDLFESIDAEYRENEIFPKSDVLEDWLKLIDLEPESVAAVRPVRPSKGEDFVRRNVI